MKILAGIEMMRPVNGFMGWLTVVIGYLNTRDVTDAFSVPGHIFWFGMVYIFIVGAGMIINDIYDYRIDLVNRPDRPIPRGDVSLGEAKTLFGIVLGLGLLLAFFHGVATDMVVVNMTFTATFGLVGWLYAAYGKKSGFAGNILVSLSFTMGLIYGALINGLQIPGYIVYFFLTSFFLLMAREIIKGCEDVEGDRTESVNTLAILMGTRKSALIAACFSFLAMVFFVLPVFAPIINPGGFILVMIPGVAVVGYASLLAIKPGLQKKDFTHISRLQKAGAYLGLVAILVASFDWSGIFR